MDAERTLFLNFIDPHLLFGGVSLVILLVCSALISGAEVALFSLSKSDLEPEENTPSKALETIIALLHRPKKLLATILVANNFINIGIVLLFASLSEHLFKGVNSELDLVFFKIDLVFFIEVIIITFLILMFGEILPKIYANRNNLKFSKFMARPLKILDVLFAPISMPMRRLTLMIHKGLGKQKSNLNVDYLSQALELTSEEDTTKEEQKILQGIVSFGNTDTKQVMRPRIDIFALESSLKFEAIIPEIVAHGYSRIPVYENSIDSVSGILYAKDLLPHLQKKEFDWNSLLRVPLFVPENKKLDDLMVEFQEKKIHLAIVVDEYGGTSGVVSLEDVIEEIVGDISDEFDDDDLIYSKIDENNYVFDGKTALKDFYRIIKLKDESIFENHKGEAETIAGFVLEISKSFPKIRSKIKFNSYTFIVEGIDNKRIKQLKVTLLK
ncbi:gliding motility-associated protein GldE [Flavobacteriaceae bacterium]|uniref:gliding motility-associated protein GldE n=1 Tax=Formosa sp. Hel3_A1_48 TaxID=1336795 RepID=UPI00084E3266|nr:gliding motility-associated protein GldE [Formosa sp. Hel3_A1_48]MDC0950558.1 gliding motility-associated protein GldE [Flavobacteriaceae bacterium]